MAFVQGGRRGTRNALLYCKCLFNSMFSSSAERRKGLATEEVPASVAEMILTFRFSEAPVRKIYDQAQSFALPAVKFVAAS